MKSAFKRAWAWLHGSYQGLRSVFGDDAYERYLAHHRACHAEPPLDRGAYYRSELERKWSGVRRCC